MIVTSILIALAVNGLMINTGYQWLLNKLHLNVKPFNCVLCLSFWIGVIVAVIGLNPIGGVIPLAASFIAVALSRWFDSLPMKFK